MKSKLLSVSIIVAALLMAVGLIVNSLPNRYKVVGNRVFDTITGSYISNKTSIEEDYASKVDNSKVKIINQSGIWHNSSYLIELTVQNNDTATHKICARAKFYDRNKSPVLTVYSTGVTLNPGDITLMKIEHTGVICDQFDSFVLELFE